MEDTGVILLPVRPPLPGRPVTHPCTGWKYGNDHIVCGRTAKMWPCYANNDRLRLPAYMHFWMFLFLRVSVAYAINFQPDHFAHREPNSWYVHELPSATGHHRRCGRFLATNTEFTRGEYGN